MTISIKNIDGSTWGTGAVPCINSCRLIYTAGTTQTELLNGIESFITSGVGGTYGNRGWIANGVYGELVSATTTGTTSLLFNPTTYTQIGVTIAGINATNSENGVLYWDLKTSGSATIKLYKSSADRASLTGEVATASAAIFIANTPYALTSSFGLIGYIAFTNAPSASQGTLTPLANYRPYKAPCLPDSDGAIAYKHIGMYMPSATQLQIRGWEKAGDEGYRVCIPGSIGLTYNTVPIDLGTGGSIYIMCRPEYIWIQSGNWGIGYIEHERANAEDKHNNGAGATPAASYSTAAGDISKNSSQLPGKTRGKDNALGQFLDVSTIFGASSASTNVTAMALYSYAKGYPSNFTGKMTASDFTLIQTANAFDVYGRLLYFKMVSTGLTMDEVMLKTTDGLLDPTGELTTYLVLCSSVSSTKYALPK